MSLCATWWRFWRPHTTCRRTRLPRSPSRLWRTSSSAASCCRRRESSRTVKAVVTTVTRASVTVDGEVVGAIDDGLLVLVGVTHTDGPAQAQALARKVHELRILPDERSAAEVGAPLLVVSQFTLYA